MKTKFFSAIVVIIILIAIAPSQANECNFDIFNAMNSQVETAEKAAGETSIYHPPEGVELIEINATKSPDEVFAQASAHHENGSSLKEIHEELAEATQAADAKLAQTVRTMKTEDLERDIQAWIDHHCPKGQPLPGLDEASGFNFRRVEDLVRTYNPHAPRSTPLGNVVANIQSSVLSTRRFLREPEKAFYDLDDSFDREQYLEDLKSSYNRWRQRSAANHMFEELQHRLNASTLPN